MLDPSHAGQVRRAFKHNVWQNNTHQYRLPESLQASPEG